MKRKLLLSAGICVFLVAFVVSTTAFTANADEITIMGTVVVLHSDDNDKVLAVSIETADGSFYDVTNNSIGKQLLELLGKSVEATGVAAKDEDGYNTITVKTYKVLAD